MPPPMKAVRYNERSVVERSNGCLRDKLGTHQRTFCGTVAQNYWLLIVKEKRPVWREVGCLKLEKVP